MKMSKKKASYTMNMVDSIELPDYAKKYMLDNNIYEVNGKYVSAKQNIYEEVEDLRSKNANLLIELAVLKNKKNEKFYQVIVEKYLKGTHSRNIHGITDVTNDYVHAEIKKICDYKTAVGQLLAYDSADQKKELHIYLFNDENKEQLDNVSVCLKSLKSRYSINIQLFKFNVTDDKVEIIEYETNEIKFTHIF
jgi:hypothetical protein